MSDQSIIEVQRLCLGADIVLEDTRLTEDGSVRFVHPRLEIKLYKGLPFNTGMESPADWYCHSSAGDGRDRLLWTRLEGKARKDAAEREKYQRRYPLGASVPTRHPDYRYRHLRLRKLYQFPPADNETPEVRARRAAVATKLAVDIDYHDRASDLYHRRRAEWVEEVNKHLPEPVKKRLPKTPNFSRFAKWEIKPYGMAHNLGTRGWGESGQRPASRETYLPMLWDEMVGLGCVRWAGQPRPKLPTYTTLEDLFYWHPLDDHRWEGCKPHEVLALRELFPFVDIGGYERQGGRTVWHVPDFVVGDPSAAKKLQEEVRAVLRSRSASARRGVIWVGGFGDVRLGQPKQLANEYEFWVNMERAWVPGSLLVLAQEESEEWHPAFRSVVLAENRKRRRQNKKRAPEKQRPSLAWVEAAPHDFAGTLLRFTGKHPEPGERVNEYPKGRPDLIEQHRQTFLTLYGEWKAGNRLELPACPGLGHV